MSKFKQYINKRHKTVSEMRPYIEGETLDGVCVSEPDRLNGRPMLGDMIARDPDDRESKWLVASEYFATYLELITD